MYQYNTASRERMFQTEGVVEKDLSPQLMPATVMLTLTWVPA